MFALLFTGIHRCANQPGMVYIYEKLIHIKPRHACVFLKGQRANALKTSLYASSRRNWDRIAPKISAFRHLAGDVGIEPT